MPRWSAARKRFYGGQIIKPTPAHKGYLNVSLYVMGNGTYYRKVHRLVLEAFVGKRPAGHECRHLDGDNANNRRKNLLWGTRWDNAADIEKHGTRPRGETHPAAILTEKLVRDIRKSKKANRFWADALGVHIATIRMARNGQNWGYIK